MTSGPVISHNPREASERRALGPAPPPVVAAPAGATAAHIQLNSFQRRLEMSRFWRDPVGYVIKNYERHGALSAFGGERLRWLFAYSPELNREVMYDVDLYHWAGRARWKAAGTALGVLRANIPNLEGEEYWTRRDFLKPAFHGPLVNSWVSGTIRLTQETLDGWTTPALRDVMGDMHWLIQRIAFRNVLGTEDPDVVHDLFHLSETLDSARPGGLAALFTLDLPGSPYRTVRRAAEGIIAILSRIIAAKHAYTGPPTDMLGAIMAVRSENGERLSDTELVSEGYNLMIQETTMSALMWTLILLVSHPDVYADVVDELTGVLRGSAPALQDFARLPLLDRVVKEALRLMPPQAVNRRFNSRPCRLGPFELPQGTLIIVSSYITHRLPELYTAPRRFLPRRWEANPLTTQEYFPFGDGTHACPGRVLATMNIKIVLSMLLQRYRLGFPEGLRLDRRVGAGLLLSPRPPVRMNVVAQDRQFAPSRLTGTIHDLVELA